MPACVATVPALATKRLQSERDDMDYRQPFDFLEQVHARPRPFETYTTKTLWTDEHISARMLEFHLNPESDAASRRPQFITASLDWIGRRFEIGEGKSVADFGCGPGRYTTGLAARGASVTGIDFSEGSIAYAREQARQWNLQIDYLHERLARVRSAAEQGATFPTLIRNRMFHGLRPCEEPCARS